jgi:hypothetical protein
MTRSLALALTLGAALTATSMTAVLPRAPRSPDVLLIVNLEDAERGTIVGWHRRPGERPAAASITVVDAVPSAEHHRIVLLDRRGKLTEEHRAP